MPLTTTLVTVSTGYFYFFKEPFSFTLNAGMKNVEGHLISGCPRTPQATAVLVFLSQSAFKIRAEPCLFLFPPSFRQWVDEASLPGAPPPPGTRFVITSDAATVGLGILRQSVLESETVRHMSAARPQTYIHVTLERVSYRTALVLRVNFQFIHTAGGDGTLAF